MHACIRETERMVFVVVLEEAVVQRLAQRVLGSVSLPNLEMFDHRVSAEDLHT